jgi:predicted type IV restriction endonuclease
MDKETAYKKISELVNRFEEHKESYQNSDYNETKTRRDFIDPFFKAIGWDIDNEQGLAEAYREVIHEDKLKIDDTTKAPDYCFTIYGQKKFYVEAKKPSVEIKDANAPAYQVRRYGWSAKLPISILTDFEEFAIYDCLNKPYPTDKPSVSRIKYLTYNDYLNEFDFLYDTFSKENILKGSFDKFVTTSINKKGTTSVDNEFLKSMEDWRKSLAINIALRNDSLNEDEMNYKVQQTIDRLIFLRICEDRKIEPYGTLKSFLDSVSIYEKLFQYFQKADDKYNSGLFDFKKDKLTQKLIIDNKILKSIITEMYYPACPYEFSVIPVEILGNSYEQFLGSVIRLTSGHHAKVEIKPEVRKAGGVYYTPQYIVEYIVKNTVENIIENKTPAEISKIKILDPACGSGSFLLGAYQYLLNYHFNYYHSKSTKGTRERKNIPLTPDGRLSTAEKKRILTNNIFGVDIDTQAVEVTKLSLLLKCMEGETEASVNEQLSLFHERVLPNLEDNIKCGNSLIDVDFYDSFIDFPNAEKQIKPFNWHKTFSDIFSNGGFDAVIGNPPWISLTGKFGNDILSNDELQYLIDKYQGNTYMPNIYEYFVNKGLSLIKKGGIFSFIVPDRLGFNSQFNNLRKLILESFQINELLYKAPFPNIVTDTLIFRITKPFSKLSSYEIIIGEFGKNTQTKTKDEILSDKEFKWSYSINDETEKILTKVFNKKSIPLGEIIESTSGFGGKSELITPERKNNRQIIIIRGRSIKKYLLCDKYYFEFKKENITGRTTDKNKLGVMEKVVLRKTGYPLFATYDDSGIFPEQSVYFLFNPKKPVSLKYLTGIINSQLFQFVYWHKLVTNRDSTPQLKKVDLDKFPIIYEENNSEINDIIHNVDNLLKLYPTMEKKNLSQEREQIKTRIEYSENKIDDLIYKLYGLSNKEITFIKAFVK